MPNKYRIYQGNNPIAITDVPQYELTQLQPNTEYQFSVAAFNEVVEGKKQTVSFTTKAANFDVLIEHNLSTYPTVTVQYYEYAIGTEPKGLGTGPTNSFGGINYSLVDVTVDYPNLNSCIVHLPAQFQLSGQPKLIENSWYLIDGFKTLRFDLKKNDGTGNAPKTPTGLRYRQIYDKSVILDWEEGKN